MSLIVSKTQHEERIRICDACEHKKFFMSVAYCGQCNCGLGGKQLLTSLNCPLEKWPILSIKS
jgi:hypothetical protein